MRAIKVRNSVGANCAKGSRLLATPPMTRVGEGRASEACEEAGMRGSAAGGEESDDDDDDENAVDGTRVICDEKDEDDDAVGDNACASGVANATVLRGDVNSLVDEDGTVVDFFGATAVVAAAATVASESLGTAASASAADCEGEDGGEEDEEEEDAAWPRAVSVARGVERARCLPTAVSPTCAAAPVTPT